MFEVIGNRMYITKGDDAVLTVYLEEDEGVPHIGKVGDKVNMTIKDRVGGTSLTTFTKQLTDNLTTNEISMNITHERTSTLEVGVYCADVQYIEASTGKIYTIWPRVKNSLGAHAYDGTDAFWRNFVVVPEITVVTS